MSGVSKINADIERYREGYGDISLVIQALEGRLADALESATRVPEQGEASAAVERVRAIAERHGVKPWTEEIFAALDGVPEPVSVRCGGCRDLGPHNYGPGCEYRQKGESE